MQKMVLFVFNGDPMCFVHVLLNALDMNAKGYTAPVVIEGSATKLLPEMEKPEHPLSGLWQQVKENGLVDGVCRACSNKMGTLQNAEDQGLPLLAGMSGHPSMAGYRDAGYEILIF